MNPKCLMQNMKLVENYSLKDFIVEPLNKYVYIFNYSCKMILSIYLFIVV